MMTMKGFPVVTRFPIHWAELDALGHVNNTRYFTWFETARMALFEQVGLEFEGTPKVGPILAHTSCDFKRPVTYPANVLSGTRIASLGTTSFVMEFQVCLEEEPDVPVAQGRGIIVLIDYGSGAKTPIPEALRSKLEDLAGGE